MLQTWRPKANLKTCVSCETTSIPETEATLKSNRKGKVVTRKRLTLMEEPIGNFICNHYLPAMVKYSYHRPHVIILGKKHCGAMRVNAFKNSPGSVKTRRDYAERLSATFDLEIQSEHFGNGRSLSMEGSSVEFHIANLLQEYKAGNINVEELEQEFEFISHFSDVSRQDSTTTNAHMDVLIRNLKAKGRLWRMIFEETDGCCKQYRCGTALWLLSMLSSKFDITIDRAIGAPGHGKDVVDWLNATDKRFLRGKMCLIGTPESTDSVKRMAAHSMVGDASFSLAEECVRLCSEEGRAGGVKSEKKYQKREENATVKQRTYLLQKESDVLYQNIKMEAKGFMTGEHNGIGAMYHLRTDPDLGVSKAAVRRIPCLCDACLAQLEKPSIKERYARSESCVWADVFQDGHLNDWHIIDLVPKSGSDPGEFEDAQTVVLESIADRYAEEIQEGCFGAFMTSDTTTDGYYLVQWSSAPYTLQSDSFLEEYDPPLLIRQGELVCDAKYFNKVPRATAWYTPPQVYSSTTVVRLQQVVASEISLVGTTEARLPNTCDRKTAERLHAKKISDKDHDAILEEIGRREGLEHDEDASLGDASGDGSSSSSSEEDGSLSSDQE